MKIRRLTDVGRDIYATWLADRTLGEAPPSRLLLDEELTEMAFDVEIDPQRVFSNRMEFGRYVADLLDHEDAKALLSPKNDGLWDWLTVLYFSQFGRKVSKSWHYTVILHSTQFADGLVSWCDPVERVGTLGRTVRPLGAPSGS